MLMIVPPLTDKNNVPVTAIAVEKFNQGQRELIKPANPVKTRRKVWGLLMSDQ
jgi:hypothetical protein